MQIIQGLDGFVVRQRTDRFQVKGPAIQFCSQYRKVSGFLPGDADRAHSGFAEFRHLARRNPTGCLLQARVHRTRLRKRHLLLEHQQGERGKSGFARPQGWRAVALNHRGKARLHAGQRAQRGAERSLVKNLYFSTFIDQCRLL